MLLEDAHMDVCAVSNGTARAVAVLRARRLAQRREADWLLTASGLDALRGGRSSRADPHRERPELVYEIDWDGDERPGEWQGIVAQTH